MRRRAGGGAGVRFSTYPYVDLTLPGNMRGLQRAGAVRTLGKPEFDWAVPRFEIGYWCRSSRTGQGFVTEAVQALTAMAFDTLGARRVEIFTDDLNQASWRVAERAGFVLEGVHRHMRIDPDGTLRDMRVYAQVR